MIVISGTFGGTGSISGYANPTTYYVIGTPSTTTAQLSATPGGGAITSSAGTPSGLTYILTTGAVITVPGPNPGFTYATATGLIAQIDPAFSTAPTTNWRSIIDTSIESAESLLRMNATNHRAASANISPMNKNQNIGLDCYKI